MELRDLQVPSNPDHCMSRHPRGKAGLPEGVGAVRATGEEGREPSGELRGSGARCSAADGDPAGSASSAPPALGVNADSAHSFPRESRRWRPLPPLCLSSPAGRVAPGRRSLPPSGPGCRPVLRVGRRPRRANRSMLVRERRASGAAAAAGANGTEGTPRSEISPRRNRSQGRRRAQRGDSA